MERIHRQKRFRQARVTLAIMAGTIAAAQLIVGGLLDYGAPGWRFQGLDQGLKACRKAKGDGPLIAVLGSSRFGGGILPKHVADHWQHESAPVRVVNLCVPGGDFISAEYLYQRIKQMGQQPDVILIEITPENLAKRNLWLNMHCLRQFTWLDGPRYTIDLVRSGHMLRFVASRLNPIYVYREQIRLQLEKRWLPEAWLEDQPFHLQQNVGLAFQEVGERAQGNFTKHDIAVKTYHGVEFIRRWLRDYEVGGTAKEAFDRLMAACHRDGCRVILMGPPLAAAHRQLYTPDIEQRFQQTIRESLERYPLVDFIDARAAMPDDCFFDNHHLTHHGAMRFSQWVAERLQPVVQSLESNRAMKYTSSR